MSEFVECKHCGGELRFVQMDEEHTQMESRMHSMQN